MVDKELAKFNPASVYKHPHDILKDSTLSKTEKIDILKRWSYDEREMSVAEEENMLAPPANHNDKLDEINKCLLELGVDSTKGEHPPTKQG